LVNDSFELNETTIEQLQNDMLLGRRTARNIAELYLSRIKLVDRNGPQLRSVIEINPDALTMAHSLDADRERKGPRGPLHGIPILIKDNIDTADRMATTAGSLALQGSIATRDAFIVSKLRAAGALILGKTNLSEWANFRSTHSVSGWSARGGQTRNPYALDRNPCGSSSGSAVAVAANLCVAAIGTETDGSVVCPSSVNGIVGVKPTLGLVSRAGLIPIAHSQDTTGVIARTVRDAALVLSALVGIDPDDPATENCPIQSHADYSSFLDPDGLKGARLGVARQFFGTNSAVDRLMEGCIEEMKRRGAEIIDPVSLPSHKQYDDSEFQVLLYEFKHDLNEYLSNRGDSVTVRSLSEVIRFNETKRNEEMPYFEQEIMLQAEEKGPLSERGYRDALTRNRHLSRSEGIDAAIAKDELDAFVAPTTGPAWLTDWVTGDHETGSCSTPAAVAGYPHITVPAGFVHGLPIGISFFGPAWSEPTLLKLAYGFEQATTARRPPQFLPTVQLDS
jgi:amidase